MAPQKEDDRSRYKELFEKLDTNNDGKIEINELAEGLKNIQGYGSEKQIKENAQDFLDKASKDHKNVNFAEFASHMMAHEKKIKLVFSDLDKNHDGTIKADEVQAAMRKLGMEIDDEQAVKLINKLDKDKSLSVDWEEWRTFFQFQTQEDIKQMVHFWHYTVMLDVDESLSLPPDFTKKERQTGLWWRHLVAGGMAGMVSRTCTAPLDRLRIMLQAFGSKEMSLGQTFRGMLNEGGVRSLWRGNGVTMVKIIPESALRFAFYEQMKGLIVGDKKGEVNVYQRFAAGSTAGALAQFVVYPLEVMKVRMAISTTGQYNGMFDGFRQVVRQEGFSALYRGYTVNLLSIVPYAGLDLSIYETLKTHYMKTHPDLNEPGVVVSLCCGTISITIAQVTTYPLALIKTKLQAGASTEAEVDFIKLFKRIYRTDGIPGLYRGMVPQFGKIIPAVSISYAVYEKCKILLGLNKK